VRLTCLFHLAPSLTFCSVSELRASGSAADEVSLLKTMLPWLDAQASVQRYAYFSADLVNGKGQLIAVGQVYTS
jgi:hypothetical protein